MATVTAAGAPTIATFSTPIPVVMQIVLTCLVLLGTVFLPQKGGQDLPKTSHMNESLTMIQGDNINDTFQDSLMLIVHGYAGAFNESYQERADGTSRLRLNDSRMDPDAFMDEHTRLAQSQLAKKWDFDFTEEHERSVQHAHEGKEILDKWNDQLPLEAIEEN